MPFCQFRRLQISVCISSGYGWRLQNGRQRSLCKGRRKQRHEKPVTAKNDVYSLAPQRRHKVHHKASDMSPRPLLLRGETLLRALQYLTPQLRWKRWDSLKSYSWSSSSNHFNRRVPSPVERTPYTAVVSTSWHAQSCYTDSSAP